MSNIVETSYFGFEKIRKGSQASISTLDEGKPYYSYDIIFPKTIIETEGLHFRKYVAFDQQIDKQLAYLRENLDEDQDKEIFKGSVDCFKRANLSMIYEKPPVLSVDNSGYLIAEWRGYQSYDILLMMFSPNDRISLTAIKGKILVKKISGTMIEVTREFGRL